MRPRNNLTVLAAVLVGLSGCGGGSGDTGGGSQPPPTYSIGGTVTGLAGAGLVLQNNGASDLPVGAGASTFAFSGSLGQGASFGVSVKAQPTNPSQICSVSSGSGTVGAANVTTVAVTCTNSVPAITLGGSVSGLAGTGLVLKNNGTSVLNIAAGATSFTFPGALPAGAAYIVTVGSQPYVPWQTCTVTNGAGNASAAVTDVAITCTTIQYTVGGSVTGLTGSGLTLQLNSGAPLAIAAGSNSFTFPALPSMTPYTLTVATQPTGPAQICWVATGGGPFVPSPGPQSEVTNGNIINALVDCGVAGSGVGGTASGLTGSGLALKLNGGVALSIPAGATTFSFPAGVTTGDRYGVTIAGQPSGQTCTLLRAKGMKGTQVVSSIGLECVGNVTSPLSGTYTRAAGGFRDYLTFWPDGTFTHVTGDDDPNCPDRGNNIEYGVYNYNAGTGGFGFKHVTTDGNGPCGYTHANDANLVGTVAKGADTLAITSTFGNYTHTWHAVPSTSGSIIGSFSYAAGLSDGIDGSFLVFQADGTYLVVETQQGPGGASIVGYERACYVSSGGTITANKSSGCTPDGRPVIITNGGSLDDGVPLPFVTTGPNSVTVEGIYLLARILPN